MAHEQDFYRYTPTLGAAIAVGVIYSLAFIATIVQFIRFKSWVWTVMLLASGMEAAGYIVRSISTKHIYNKNLYVTQFSLIILAPVLMAAACYIVFGRIVFHVVPREARTLKLLWISPRFVTPIFVASDIIALFLQLVGAVMITTISNTDPNAISKAKRGKRIAQIGVAVQLACFGLFSVMAVRFNFTSKRFAAGFEERITNANEKYVTIDGQDRQLKRNWRAILRVTNIASVCILIRSAYRMVDFSLGRGGYAETHEWVMYVFDAAAILPVVVLYAWWHPGMYLPYLSFRLPKHAR